MYDSHQVVAAYWAAAEARDWPKFAALVAPNVVYEAPQTRERVRGREAYVRFSTEGFPGDWHLRVERIVGEDRHAASWTQFSDADDEYPGCASSISMRKAPSPGSSTFGPRLTTFQKPAPTWWSERG
jgi:SnoaL-like domain